VHKNACTAREQGANTSSRHVHATLRATEMSRIATKHCVPLRAQNVCKSVNVA